MSQEQGQGWREGRCRSRCNVQPDERSRFTRIRHGNELSSSSADREMCTFGRENVDWRDLEMIFGLGQRARRDFKLRR